MSYFIDDWDYFWSLGVDAVKELETERGILASARNELFGCIFGRDSLITSLQLLRVYQQTKQPEFLAIVRKVLITLSELQGKSLNIESGEEPGKIIHEYRPEGHEHLTKPGGANGHEKSWYLYPDQIMRNYDTVDATPLFLITAYRYYQITVKDGNPDQDFIHQVLPSVKAAIHWIFWYGDSNGDGLIDYQLKPERHYGGLQNQNWMDSSESTFHEDGTAVTYPLAPIEAQAYTYLALRMWAIYFAGHRNQLTASTLDARADKLKEIFDQRFVLDHQDLALASAIDGTGKPLTSVRSAMGHCLWASLNLEDDNRQDCILKKELVPALVKRLLSPDIFVPEAGIRTLSENSINYQSNSYHNGSIWPHDNSMIAEGFENWGFNDEAWLVRIAVLTAIQHFQHPMELYVYDHGYAEYRSSQGQTASKTQAWSAAAILSAVAPSYGRPADSQ